MVKFSSNVFISTIRFITEYFIISNFKLLLESKSISVID